MAVSPAHRYPPERADSAGSAAPVTGPVGKHQALNLRPAVKEYLIYLLASLLVSPLYIVSLWGLQHVSSGWITPTGIITIALLIFILPWLIVELRQPVQRRVDKILYGNRLAQRQTVLDLPKKIIDMLSLSDLAENLLEPIPGALGASHVSLLLPVNGEFISQFAHQQSGVAQPLTIKFRKDSHIVKWLADNNKPLSRENIRTASEFRVLGDAERNFVETTDFGLLVPMNSRGKLVGVLALGEKMPRGSYTYDDLDLLAKVSTESAGAVANAHLYAQTRERVHTDELTGLLSHGFFHQRIDEEIARCSRFGSIFSVLFLDIDVFKSYNDAFGHLAGDEILKKIAQCIKVAIRGIDIPFRYGGDEFSILLPEASLDDAYNVAERIRRRVESEMDSKGVAITCSIGVATWPTSGVMRESLLQAADGALYWSKQAGRNRVSLASDLSRTLGINFNGEQEVLSAVHALAATVDAKDTSTYGHSKKASEYAARVAEALHYSSDKISTLEAAALLHDIGKIKVPDRVLLKPGPLTTEELLAIREHPKFGVAILKHIKGLSACLPIIQHHHERFDGKGYPAGLIADSIPLEARILAVADAYDAMTSPRPYRPQRLSHQEAVDELLRCAGTHFDPEIVKIFAGLWQPVSKGAIVARR